MMSIAPLDRVGDLGHAERAAVSDAARRLVGVDAVDLEMRERGMAWEPVAMCGPGEGRFDGSGARASKAP